MTKFLIFLVIVLGVAAIAQLLRVYELTAKLRGDNEEKVSDKDTRFNAAMMMIFMIAFFGFCIYQMVSFGHIVLPEPASEHGVDIDQLMNFNLIIITIVFVFTNILLFYFASKYYFRKENKATFVSHNNKLEMIWTIIPAIVLSVIIIYGLRTWNNITEVIDPNKTIQIELYAKQFDWTARYAGKDNVLGLSNYKLITDVNPLGLVASDQTNSDDILTKGEFHLPIGKEILFSIRSRDVIHSAYMPHFRAQMNAVPGMVTNFHFKPTITTAEMRQKLNNPKFNYILLCNKICGTAHYNMQMDIIVESEADYNAWLAKQKTFGASLVPAEEVTAKPEVAKADSTMVATIDSVKLALNK